MFFDLCFPFLEFQVGRVAFDNINYYIFIFDTVRSSKPSSVPAFFEILKTFQVITIKYLFRGFGCKIQSSLSKNANKSVIMAFKCMAGYAPKSLCSKFSKQLEISQRETRNCVNLNIPICKLSTGQRSFHYRTVKLWNALETNLKNVDSLSSFKRQLKSHLLKQF